MPLAPGTKLGPYEITAPIGAGGMGEVYRARDTRLGRDVALKILPGDLAQDPSRRTRFELEARAVAALNHPNIVAVYDVGEGYMVSELVDGESLRDAKFGLRKALDVAEQIASGLAAAHAAGIVHRDLKPDNVLLTKDGRAKILDFGLARRQPSPSDVPDATRTVLTDPGTVMGTVAYMSPEQVRGLETDPRSDIFSFGVMLHEMLNGERPFRGETGVDTMQAILRKDAPELPDTVPWSVRQIVAHCLEKELGNRFQSAKDLGFALGAVGQSGSHASAGNVVVKARGGTLRRAGALALSAAAVAGITLVAQRWIGGAPHDPVWRGELMTGPEIAMTPKLSPDGQTLAFTAMEDGLTQPAVMKPGSGTWIILTHTRHAGQVSSLSWSPDGTRVYFDRANDVPVGIFSVPALGGEERLVLENARHPELLPDGSMLVDRINAERKYQIFRYSPGSGRLRAYPLETTGKTVSVSSVIPGGRQAVVLGKLIGQNDDARHLYLLDLDSGKTSRLLKTPEDDAKQITTLAVTPDGKSVLVAAGAAGAQVFSVPVTGGEPLGRPILYFAGGVDYMEAGPGGTVYLGREDVVGNILRFPLQGGHPQVLARVNQASQVVCALRDGRMVTAETVGGKSRLLLLETGKAPVPLLDSTEESSRPITEAGPNQVAFLLGSTPGKTIAIADVRTGRVARRVAFNQGEINSLAAAPDGRTLYAAAKGSIWAIPAEGGAPRKLRDGDAVAVAPSGQFLVIAVTEQQKMRMVKFLLDGGPEREIPLHGEPVHELAPNSVSSDGKVLTALASSDSWFYLPGSVDLASGRGSVIPLDFRGDYSSLGWDRTGQVIAWANDLRAVIWKFTPEKK